MSYQINSKKQITYYTGRFRFILIFLVFIFVLLIIRMSYLMIFHRSFLQKESNARVMRVIDDPAYRGMILDRNGSPLAISTPMKAVWVVPQNFDPNPTQLSQLARLLEVPSNTIAQLVKKNSAREFLYLRRGLQPDIGDAIASLKISGVFLRQEYRRYYPQAEVDSPVLGFTNIDDQGQEGIELAYNRLLQGQTGQHRVIKDRKGHVVEDLGVVKESVPGQNITLSIDQRIQYMAYKSLNEVVLKYGANAGSVVVLDIKTGEVLAMANAPSFNPNQPRLKRDDSLRNRAATDILEPGSTAKPFTVYLGLESGKYKPDTLIPTAPGWVMIAKHKVQDTHNHGTITVSEVLKYSSNIGVSRIVLSLPPNALWELLDKIGFGHSTNIGFPGESAGELAARKVWDPFVLSTLSFGYGLSVTPLQLAQAYATIGAYGLKRPVSLLKIEKDTVAGEQVMDPEGVGQVIKMMQSVTDDGGTATVARVPGYFVAGKTGTSRMVGPHGYMKDRHNAVFAGIAPATNPRLVVIAYIHDPRKGGYYAGTVAAPLFAKVMAESLQVLNVPTDNWEPKKDVK
jgi:cell division protein FtsI (penicillin-binding protein 3)